jgi:catechol 2,3-dioxygenase-like lactoylglutathione lyase family enzyme
VTDLRALSLLPFVPSGKDYDASRRLFADLGFQEVWENDGLAGFRNGEAQFILQRFDDSGFAGNFMVRLNVPDLDSWWLVVQRSTWRGRTRAFASIRRRTSLGAGK